MHANWLCTISKLAFLDAEEQLLNSTVTQYEQAWNDQEPVRRRHCFRCGSPTSRDSTGTTRAQAIDVGVARAQYEHAVAVLIGKPPASFSLAPLP